MEFDMRMIQCVKLSKELPARTIDPLPGWFDRRRQDLPGAEEVLATLPGGHAHAPLKGSAAVASARTAGTRA